MGEIRINETKLRNEAREKEGGSLAGGRELTRNDRKER